MVVSELEARISAGVALEVSKGSLTKGDECFLDLASENKSLCYILVLVFIINI